jgi:tRNA (mo5U34)-methyltransferase
VTGPDPIVWWHSIDLGTGVTAGHKSEQVLAEEWRSLHLPDLSGLDVLDIGAWDGFFSFEAERLGARRVVALDHYAWSMDLVAQRRYIDACVAAGRPIGQYHEQPEIWRPDSLPGKRGFDTAKAALGSEVVDVVVDFMDADPPTLGVYDVVLFLGVVYHMDEPLTALRRLRTVTKGLAVVESQAFGGPGLDDLPYLRFHAGSELADDPSNWYVPTEAGLHALCLGAGFSRVHTVSGSPPDGGGDYRIVVHAEV